MAKTQRVYWIIVMLLILAGTASAGRSDIAWRGTFYSASGVAVEDREWNISFQIFDSYTGGNQLYTLNSTVHTRNGTTSYLINDTENVDYSEDLYLAVFFDEELLSPRLNISSTPYALRANISDDLECDGCVNSSELDFTVIENNTAGWTLNFSKIFSLDWTNISISSSQITDVWNTAWNNTIIDLVGIWDSTFNSTLNGFEFSKVLSLDWTNVTLTESQISDLSHTTDTNESVRFENLTETDCAVGTLVIGVESNGTVKCATDQQGGAASDDDSNYVNKTDAEDIGGTKTFLQQIKTLDWGNVTITESQVTDLTHTVDSNETVRFENLTETDCAAGTLVIGVETNGTVKCATDQQGASADDDSNYVNKTDSESIDGIKTFLQQLRTLDWGNVTITESQITDLSHTTDTNETVRFNNLTNDNCGGTDKVIGVYPNGTVECATDQTGAGGSLDGNSSSICNDGEVLIGEDSTLCMDLNLTIDDRQTFDASSYYTTSMTYNKTDVDTNFSFYALLSSIYPASMTYNKTELDTNFTYYPLISSVYLTSMIYNKTEVDNNFSNYLLISKFYDTNATTECGDNEYLRGDGTCQEIAGITDTNETVRFDNLTEVDCPGGTLVIGVHDNGTVNCATDQSGVGGGFDGNVSSICSDEEVLMGEDSTLCMDLNITIDDRQTFDASLYYPASMSYNKTEIDSNFSLYALLTSIYPTSMIYNKTEVDNNFSNYLLKTSFYDTNATTECGDNEYLRGDGTCQVISSITDTNETARFVNLTAYDCPGGDLVLGVHDNGTVKCAADQSGGAVDLSNYVNKTDNELIDGIKTFLQQLRTIDWGNVTITESQITDLTHTTDTNVTTECGDTGYLRGDGVCITEQDLNGSSYNSSYVTYGNATSNVELGDNYLWSLDYVRADEIRISHGVQSVLYFTIVQTQMRAHSFMMSLEIIMH